MRPFEALCEFKSADQTKQASAFERVAYGEASGDWHGEGAAGGCVAEQHGRRRFHTDGGGAVGGDEGLDFGEEGEIGGVAQTNQHRRLAQGEDPANEVDLTGGL